MNCEHLSTTQIAGTSNYAHCTLCGMGLELDETPPRKWIERPDLSRPAMTAEVADMAQRRNPTGLISAVATVHDKSLDAVPCEVMEAERTIREFMQSRGADIFEIGSLCSREYAHKFHAIAKIIGGDT